MKKITAAILILSAIAALTGCYPKTCPCTGSACGTNTSTAPAK